MLYVKSIKGFEVRREKNFITLPCAKKAYDKFITLPCEKKHMCPISTVCFFYDTQQKCCLPRVWKVAHGKLWAHGKYGLSCSDT